MDSTRQMTILATSPAPERSGSADFPYARAVM